MTALSRSLALMLAMSVPALAQEAPSAPAAAESEGDEVARLREEVEQLKQRLDNGAFAMPRIGVPAGAQPPLESQITAGYALVVARPQMKESFRSTTTLVATNQMKMHPFDYDFEPSSRVWLAYRTDSGIGVRARYWRFDFEDDPYSEVATATTRPGATAVTVIYPANIAAVFPGDVLQVTNSLTVQTFDLEGTRTLKFGQTEVTGAVGLQFVQTEQSYDAQVISALVPRLLTWDRDFRGVGPSIGADVRHPLGIAGLSAVASFHAAMLFGEKTLQRTVVGDVTPAPAPPLPPPPPTVGLRGSREPTGAFEMGFGLEWNVFSNDLGALSLRGMYEGQLWTDAGAPTMTYLGFDAFSGGIVWTW